MSADPADDPLKRLFAQAQQPIAELMVKADESRRASGTRYKHAIEPDLKDAVRATLSARVADNGFGLHPTELSISPEDWPRIGGVDVVLTDLGAPAPPPGAVLKWARVDKLWHCAWDLAKAALVSRLGLARRSLLLVGASEAESSSRYGGLLHELHRATPDFLRSCHDAIGPFCRRDEGFAHPRGPYRLPPAFSSRRLGAPHRFRLRRENWTLTVLEVIADLGGACVDVDDRGLCVGRRH